MGKAHKPSNFEVESILIAWDWNQLVLYDALNRNKVSMLKLGYMFPRLATHMQYGTGGNRC
jgi:hypothetical protein